MNLPGRCLEDRVRLLFDLFYNVHFTCEPSWKVS